jgi:CRP-like cAMP-binding protein
MQMRSTQAPLQNQLLSSLPNDVRQRLLPSLELCKLTLGEVLYESGERIHHVYFPTDSIVALLIETTEGNSIETSMVGNEGLVGLTLFMGATRSNQRAVVHNTGSCYRLARQAAMVEFDRHLELMEVVLRHSHSRITQMAQMVVCNRHHSVKQRLCRFLLQLLDRHASEKLVITQEQIAYMLGVRREGVTEAAGNLQSMGVIEYCRGHIHVLDRERLEQLSCDCYRPVNFETDNLHILKNNGRKLHLQQPCR